MRALCVGLVYWPELEPLFREGNDLVSVLELEPQTLWEKQVAFDGPFTHYKVNEGVLKRIAALPQKKLLHGFGHPILGSVDDTLDYITPFKQAIRAIDLLVYRLASPGFRRPQNDIIPRSVLKTIEVSKCNEGRFFSPRIFVYQ
jgi:hypothetical protein